MPSRIPDTRRPQRCSPHPVCGWRRSRSTRRGSSWTLSRRVRGSSTSRPRTSSHRRRDVAAAARGAGGMGPGARRARRRRRLRQRVPFLVKAVGAAGQPRSQRSGVLRRVVLQDHAARAAARVHRGAAVAAAGAAGRAPAVRRVQPGTYPGGAGPVHRRRDARPPRPQGLERVREAARRRTRRARLSPASMSSPRRPVCTCAPDCPGPDRRRAASGLRRPPTRVAVESLDATTSARRSTSAAAASREGMVVGYGAVADDGLDEGLRRLVRVLRRETTVS